MTKQVESFRTTVKQLPRELAADASTGTGYQDTFSTNVG